jgi:hypothetical protein
MKDSKVTNNWWMIFKYFPPEPPRLWRLYIFALFITLEIFLIAGLYACSKHGFSADPKVNIEGGECCKKQLDYLNKYLAEATEHKAIAENRMDFLKKIRSNPDDKNFDKSWSWFEAEIKQLNEIIDKPQKLKVASVKKTFLTLLIAIFGSLLFYVFINRLILLHTKSVQEYFAMDEINRDCILPQILIGILIAVFMILAEISSSVLASQKTSFGWDSFCVTPGAFILKCLAFISYGLVAATPFTMLWCLSRKIYIPEPNPDAPDRKFGAERYVEFIQTWTLWLILAPSTLGILWLRYIGKSAINFAHAYLLHGLGVGLIIVIIIVKLIRNAIMLRFSCSEIMLKREYNGIDRLPKDPTIDFLGTEWWKLPATIGVSLAAIWAILEGLGITKFFISLIR